MGKSQGIRVQKKRTRQQPERSSSLRKFENGRQGFEGGLLGLQHSAGNQAVNRLLGASEKQTHNRSEEMEEQQADQWADRLSGLHFTGMAGQSTERSAGLPDALRAALEPRLGADMSGVRLHTGVQAASSAEVLHAQAFTVGKDIYFNQAKFAPHTVSGIKLLTHELAHTQQPAGPARRKPKAAEPAKKEETPEELAHKVREAFRGLGTNEAEVYRVLSFAPAKVKSVYDYYNKNLNDHTGQGLIADLEDEMSGDELSRAMDLIQKTGIMEDAPILARRLREAFRGLGTDEDMVYRVLSQPPATVREVINYYNDHFNDHTGQGVVEDIKDEMSGSELERAGKLLAKAGIAANTVYRRTEVPKEVKGEKGKVWVGLIVRGKWSAEHHPGVMDQHADVYIPQAAGAGKTVGYFGDQNAPGGGSSSGAGASLGLGIPGISADWDWFMANRPAYIDLELAKLVGMWSGLILIKTTAKKAAELDKHWKDLQNDPGSFYFLGKNCSTTAAAGFEQLAITKEINGLDTPDNLYGQLRQEYPDAYMISGFYGYVRAGRKWQNVGGSANLVNPGAGPWTGPFVDQPRLK